MTAPVNRYYILELPASRERAPHIRSILTAHLRYWGLAAHIGPVCRGVQELFTNVAEHAGEHADCVVELRWNGRLLTAAVSDRDPALPRPLGPARDLAAVAAVSDTWGAAPTPEGKIVWFTRRATREHDRLPAGRPAPAVSASTRISAERDDARAPHGVPS